MKRMFMVFCLILIVCGAIADTYDPMMPAGYRIEEQSPQLEKKQIKKTPTFFHLRQIVLSERGNRAVINGYVVKEGSLISQARVIKIEENKVTLVRSGKKQVLTLNRQVPRVRH